MTLMRVKQIHPRRCRRCNASLVGAQVSDRQRRQVVDVWPASATGGHRVPAGIASWYAP
jgi:hypothetical protein